MPLAPEKKKEIIKKFGGKVENTGSPEVQAALLTERIEQLTRHLKANPKDLATERSLILMVSRRKKLLNYLKEVDIERYRKVVKDLEIRK
ncbi:MAG: 30S ribosomal protein S15 [Flavobacteriales bacterium]|nr:30S ribosomal protein S15 [Flavobacteriales bacterium]MCX7651038.1 30S ribosomal protein S15 [Flavobacteriales bacterium]MDW8431840.1 30S ribosomal protein S15 [Flavobacteriales bacterium]